MAEFTVHDVDAIQILVDHLEKSDCDVIRLSFMNNGKKTDEASIYGGDKPGKIKIQLETTKAVDSNPH